MHRILALFGSSALFALAACSAGDRHGIEMGGGTPPLSPSPTPTPAPAPLPSPSPSPAPGSSAPVPPPPGHTFTPRALQPVRSENDTGEFRRNYDAAEIVDGLYAHDAGHTGQGITVGLIDDGALNIDGELDGRIDWGLSQDFGNVMRNGRQVARNQLGDAQSTHGTPVANIIAGVRNDVGSIGYAPDTRLALLRIDDWDPATGIKSFTHVVEALDWARTKGLKIVNISLSTGGNPLFGEAISRYAQTGGLVVLAAGNQGSAAPADADAIDAQARNAALFVVALAPSIYGYALEPYSNRAGHMADRTVAAPGSNVTMLADGNVSTYSGTSSAAPVVTALAATILSKWPHLSGQDAGDIILATARDIGAPGTDPIFGRGLVDFKAALAPVAPVLSNGTVSTPLAGTAMGIPAPFDPRGLRTVLSSVTIIDRYGRDYQGSLQGLLVNMASPAPSLRRLIASSSQGGSTAFAHGAFQGDLAFVASGRPDAPGWPEEPRPAAMSSGSLRFDLGRERLEVAWNGHPSYRSDIADLSAPSDAVRAYAPRVNISARYLRPVGDGWLTAAFAGGGIESMGAWAGSLAWSRDTSSVRIAMIEERGSVLGTPTGLGGLRLGRGARTMVTEFTHGLAFRGGWALGGYTSIGMTHLSIDQASLVTGATPLLATRFGLNAHGPLLSGIVELGLARPLAVQWGSVDITRALTFDRALGTLEYAASRVSVVGARGVHLTAGYARGGVRSKMRLGVLHDRDDGTTSAFATWRLAL